MPAGGSVGTVHGPSPAAGFALALLLRLRGALGLRLGRGVLAVLWFAVVGCVPPTTTRGGLVEYLPRS